MNREYEIAIVGAGPSGMMAAIHGASASKEVLLLERNREVGKKLLTTGNGRCNFTNGDVRAEHYRTSGSESFTERILSRFSLKDTLSFFDGIGILPKQRFGTGYYPNSMQASSVRDALLFCLRESGVTLCTGETVRRVEKTNSGFWLETDEGHEFHAKKLILATGGNAVPKSGSDGTGLKIAKKLGHTLIPLKPALLPLLSDAPFCKALSGVRVEGQVSLYHKGSEEPMASSKGEIQFVKTGVSGIPVFDVSRFYEEDSFREHPGMGSGRSFTNGQPSGAEPQRKP